MKVQAVKRLRRVGKHQVRRRRWHAGGRHHAGQGREEALALGKSESGCHLLLPFSPSVLEPGFDLEQNVFDRLAG